MIPFFRRLAEQIAGMIAKPGRPLMYLVIVAASISVYHYAKDASSDYTVFVSLMSLGMAGIGLHWYGAGKVVEAWHERRAVAMFFWCIVVAAAIVWEGRNQIGLASINQDAVKATRVAGWQHQEDARTSLAFAQTKAGAERKALEALRARVEATSSVSINGKPVTSPDVAQAEVDRLKGNVRFWTLTKGCTEAPGQQTRAYCDLYRAALAAKATAENRLTLEAEAKRQEATVAEAESALADAQSKALAAPSVVSAHRADIATIGRITKMSMADAELSNSLLLWVVTFVFLTIAGGLEKAESYAGKPRVQWIDWGRIGAWLRMIVTGKSAPNGSHTVVEKTTVIDPFGKAMAR